MIPALRQQLEQLQTTLAARRGVQPPLVTLEPEKPISLATRAPEPPAEPLEAVVRKDAPVTLTETVESFSARQVAKVEDDLNPLALRIYSVLHRLGCEVAQQRGYHRKAGQVSYFLPAELVYWYLGVTRGSFYRSLLELKELGLVDARGHKTTINGWAVRCDGTLWSVKLYPRKGRSAKLRFEDLKASYRDLEADIRSGRTVWAAMRQSCTGKESGVTLRCLLAWALSPRTDKDPLPLTVASSERLPLELVLDVPFAPKAERGAMVDKAARAVALHLADPQSVNFYRYLLWQLLRLRDQGQDHFQVVYQMLVRVGVDCQEGFARRAGALFVSRLKASALWEEVRGVPLVRVGEAPVRA